MAKAGYIAYTGASAVALVASTAKTVLFVMAPATFGIDLRKVRLAFDGVTSGAVPVYVELNALTGATNVTPGTGNTSVTVNQLYGRSITAGFTAGANCSSEPTVQTTNDGFLLTPNGGLLFYDWPLGESWDSPVSNGFCIRMTAPAAVNVRATLVFERC